MTTDPSIRGPFFVLAPSLRRHAGNLAIAVSAAIGAQLIGIPLPLMARWILNHATERDERGGVTVSEGGGIVLLWFGIALGVVVILHGVFRWLEGVYGARLAQRVIAEVRARMYAHMQRLPSGYFERRGPGRVLIRFVGDANALQNWLSRILVTAPADVLTLVAIAVAMAIIQPQLLLAAFAPLLVVIPALVWINPRARRWTREGLRQRSHLCDHLAERVSNMKAVKASNQQLVDQAQTTELIQGVAAVNLVRARLDAWTASISVVGAAAGIAAIVLWGAWLLSQGAVTHADLMACLLMSLLCRGPINRLARANMVHQRARVVLERIQALLARETEPGWSDELQPYSGPGQSIRLKRLGRKAGEDQWIIRGLSCKIDGPGLVAVTGEAGNAKTLLLELLLRLRLPHEGSYYLDGHDVRRLRVADVRGQMGWVDRHATLVFSLLVGDVEDPARAGLLRDLAFLLPAQETAETSEVRPVDARLHNARLTRGERLRAALSYALAGRPPIILLDDPTAGLDSDRAERLTGWLAALAREKLVIVATQDPRVIAASSQALNIPRVTIPDPDGQAAPEAVSRSETAADIENSVGSHAPSMREALVQPAEALSER